MTCNKGDFARAALVLGLIFYRFYEYIVVIVGFAIFCG